MMPTRILIADDHPIVRAGLRGILAGEPGIEVSGEVTSYHELWDALATNEPDVLLLDLRMPGGAGLDAVHQLRQRHPSVRILVISSYAESSFLVRLLQAGAAGYLQKDSAAERVADAVRAVAAGETWMSEAGAQTLARAAGPVRTQTNIRVLSPREFEILCLLGQGMAAGEIAAHLSISVKTVSTHRTRLMGKLGLATTADIVRYVMEQDLTT